MNDLEKFIETYKQFGIDVKTYENEDGNIEVELNGWGEDATKSDKFGGYTGFSSTITFTPLGEFIRQSFWED